MGDTAEARRDEDRTFEVPEETAAGAARRRRAAGPSDAVPLDLPPPRLRNVPSNLVEGPGGWRALLAEARRVLRGGRDPEGRPLHAVAVTVDEGRRLRVLPGLFRGMDPADLGTVGALRSALRLVSGTYADVASVVTPRARRDAHCLAVFRDVAATMPVDAFLDPDEFIVGALRGRVELVLESGAGADEALDATRALWAHFPWLADEVARERDVREDRKAAVRSLY